MKVIVYICANCRDYNKHHRDDKDFVQKGTELPSFGDAVQHVMEGHTDVYSVVREEDNG